jgi:hypothetical protein
MPVSDPTSQRIGSGDSSHYFRVTDIFYLLFQVNFFFTEGDTGDDKSFLSTELTVAKASFSCCPDNNSMVAINKFAV